jgi:alkanesulfonate monooxygenase SsuD/methylene tetrahydromethanopterin reductase-like flavin-dependent oxidoreductase (luciferase family)
MAQNMPAVGLVATPGRRRRVVELAQEIERRGYAGLFLPSLGANMSLCEALAWNTSTIPFCTAIAPIYARTVSDFAASSAFMHEVSGGRFSLGIGIAHGPSHVRMGVTPGKPLGDTRGFVERYLAQEGVGPLAPMVLAAMRKRMVALAGEIGQGVIFANACLSHMKASLDALPERKRADPGFMIADMIPTCISDDLEAAKAVNRRTLTGYAFLPNYRNYWKEAGYEQEMLDIEKAIDEGRREDVPKMLTDRWLADVTLFGTAAQVREKVEAWQEAGVRTVVLVPSSAKGNQLVAMEEMFATFG